MDLEQSNTAEETEIDRFLSTTPMPSFENRDEIENASFTTQPNDGAAGNLRKLAELAAASPHINSLKSKLIKYAPEPQKHGGANPYDVSLLDDDESRTPPLLVLKYSQVDTDANETSLAEGISDSHALILDDGPPSVSAFFNDDDTIPESTASHRNGLLGTRQIDESEAASVGGDLLSAKDTQKTPAKSSPVSVENVIAALYVDHDRDAEPAGNQITSAPNNQVRSDAVPFTDSVAAVADSVFARARAEILSKIDSSRKESSQDQHSDNNTPNEANYEAYFDDDFDTGGADVQDEPNIYPAAATTGAADHAVASNEQLPFAGNEREDDPYDLSFDNEMSAAALDVEQQLESSVTDMSEAQTDSIFAAVAQCASVRQLKTGDSTFRALVCYFNHEPFRALHYMIANGFVAGTAQHICEDFLLPNSDTVMCTRSTLTRGGGCVCRLSRLRLGELLCDDKNMASHALLEHWLAMHNFAGSSVEVALRTLLRTFALPHDAVKIQHLSRVFARRYTERQDTAVPTDEALQDTSLNTEHRVESNQTLANHILLLNANLHNIQLSNAAVENVATPANTKKRKRAKKLPPMSFEVFQAELARSLSAIGSSEENAGGTSCSLTTRQLEHLYDSIRLSPITCDPDHTETLSDLHDMLSSTRSSRKWMPPQFARNNPQRWLVVYYFGVIEMKPTIRTQKKQAQQQRPSVVQKDRRSSDFYQHQRGSILRSLLLRLVSSAGRRRKQSKEVAANNTANVPFFLHENSGISGNTSSPGDFRLKDRVLLLLNDMVLIARETRREVWKRKYLRGGAHVRTRRGAPSGLRLCRALPFRTTSDIQICDEVIGTNVGNVAVLRSNRLAFNISTAHNGVCQFTHPSTVLLSEMCEQIRQAIEVNAEFLRLRPILDETPMLSKLPMLPDKAFLPSELDLSP